MSHNAGQYARTAALQSRIADLKVANRKLEDHWTGECATLVAELHKKDKRLKSAQATHAEDQDTLKRFQNMTAYLTQVASAPAVSNKEHNIPALSAELEKGRKVRSKVEEDLRLRELRVASLETAILERGIPLNDQATADDSYRGTDVATLSQQKVSLEKRASELESKPNMLSRESTATLLPRNLASNSITSWKQREGEDLQRFGPD